MSQQVQSSLAMGCFCAVMLFMCTQQLKIYKFTPASIINSRFTQEVRKMLTTEGRVVINIKKIQDLICNVYIKESVPVYFVIRFWILLLLGVN